MASVEGTVTHHLRNEQSEPDMSPSLVLIGARGAGKSTVGPILAGHLGVSFEDLDVRAQARSGCDSVKAVFDEQGESAWRGYEAAALTDAIDAAVGVIAAGGGLPCVEPGLGVLQAARAGGQVRVIWLRCSPEVMRDRLAEDVGDRPALLGMDSIEEAVEVASRRAPLYEAIADVTVDAQGTPDAVVARLIEGLGQDSPVD